MPIGVSYTNAPRRLEEFHYKNIGTSECGKSEELTKQTTKKIHEPLKTYEDAQT